MKNGLLVMSLTILLVTGFMFLEAQEYDWSWAVSAGSEGDSRGRSIDYDEDGNAYITGTFNGTIHFGEIELHNYEGNDIFVAKMDNEGNWLWARRAGGAETSANRAWTISVDSEGNVFIVGSYHLTATFGEFEVTSGALNSSNIYVAKLDGEGNWLWVATAGNNFAWRNNVLYGMTLDNENNPIVTGHVRATTMFGDIRVTASAEPDILVAKLDGNNGNWLWVTHSTGHDTSRGLDLVIDSDGNIYAVGYHRGIHRFGDIQLGHEGAFSSYLIKLDSDGNILWGETITSEGRDLVRGIAIDSQDNVYISGNFYGTLNLGDIQITARGESEDTFVAKMDERDEWEWAVTAGSEQDDERILARLIAVDSDNNIYHIGSFEGTADFGDIVVNSFDGLSGYLSKLDTEGNWLWVKTTSGEGDEDPRSIAIDGNNNIYLTGDFTNTADFGNIRLESAGGADMFSAKLVPGDRLSSPVIRVDMVNIDDRYHVRLSWEAVEDAASYRIYASNSPNTEDWGEPLAETDATEYTFPEAADLHRTMFYYVTASAE